MLQQLYESAGTPYLPDRDLGTPQAREDHDGRHKGRCFMASHLLLMSRNLTSSFRRLCLIFYQGLAAGMALWHPVFQTGRKFPEGTSGICISRASHYIFVPSFPIWLSVCWVPDRKPRTGEAEVRVTAGLSLLTAGSASHPPGLSAPSWFARAKGHRRRPSACSLRDRR